MWIPLLIAMLAAGGATARDSAAVEPPTAAVRAASATGGGVQPRWALVLSGGLARGLAHIGVLRALEEQGLRPDLVMGSSMGSLVGAMWAGGHSSRQIQERFRHLDVQTLFDPHPRDSWWRGDIAPRPWLHMFGGSGVLRFPTGLVDDGFLNDLLVRNLLIAEARSQGDFDHLPIAWRAVATDLQSLSPVVLDSGSVARAVRSSVSVPIVFSGVFDGSRLLGDGDVASHLPVALARAEGVDHVLAIDVAVPLAPLDDHTSALSIASGMLQQISRRGQTEARPGIDHVLWLRMPGVSAADFTRVDSLAGIGYRESRDTIARLAREWRLRGGESAGAPAPLAPLTRVEWRRHDGTRARMAAAADRLFGTLPAGPFVPDTLAGPLAHVHRGDLFQSAWPRFRSDAGATTVTFDVREHAPAELTVAAGFDRDLGLRGSTTLEARPFAWSRPPVMLVGATARRFGRSGYGSLEPWSLARGAHGPFLRVAARHRDTRLFDADRDWRLLATDRVETLVGMQAHLPSGDIVQAGGGIGRIWNAGRTREGVLAAVKLDQTARTPRRVEAIALGGNDRYASVTASIAPAFSHAWGTVRPRVAVGWASRGAPLDELHGVGGPATLVGMLHDEWLGRRAIAAELRIVRSLAPGFDADGYVQCGHVAHPVSRTDLADRLHIAAGVGLRANILFGPLALDVGLGEEGMRRFELSFGPEF